MEVKRQRGERRRVETRTWQKERWRYDGKMKRQSEKYTYITIEKLYVWFAAYTYYTCGTINVTMTIHLVRTENNSLSQLN